jgi:inner membrane protein
MDNLSHSVVGLAAGELIHRSLAPEIDSRAQATRRRMLLAAGGLACNFPDLDLVLSPLLPAPLGYLLHHRGHTHTLLYAIPQALLLMALIWALLPAARTLLRASGPARRGLAATVAAGLLLHIGMDALNSYGVHPFHPFDSRWWYGDLVFILEPVFWIAFGAPLLAMVGGVRYASCCLPRWPRCRWYLPRAATWSGNRRACCWPSERWAYGCSAAMANGDGWRWRRRSS